jgi:phosphoribosyl-dephospho-CoA transferase|tara:strand:+ start:212 stop:442 length:231 start_codon:yes stop_codon:yes gene_type:complete
VDAEGALFLTRLWPIAGAFVAVIVWLVRLEGAVKMNTKLRHELDEALEELKTEFKDHRREIWGRTDYLRDLINGKN